MKNTYLYVTALTTQVGILASVLGTFSPFLKTHFLIAKVCYTSWLENAV